MIVKKIEDVVYPSPYWWNPSVNPEASVANGLGNCTCFVVGCLKASSLPDCIASVTDANTWHRKLINGWFSVPYSEYKDNLKEGDIIEWESGNHVAIVSDFIDGKPWISGSFYTGVDGKAYSDGKYSTREGINSLKQLNDFMLTNYQYRYFHFVPLETESSWCGGEPDYVLVSPKSIIPVARDNSKAQVYVGVTGLRVRIEPNTNSGIRGIAPNGYFNVDEVIDGSDYKWYRIGDLYIAGVEGVIYYPKEEIAPLEEMVALIKKMDDAYRKVLAENEDLKARLERIKELC